MMSKDVFDKKLTERSEVRKLQLTIHEAIPAGTPIKIIVLALTGLLGEFTRRLS